VIWYIYVCILLICLGFNVGYTTEMNEICFLFFIVQRGYWTFGVYKMNEICEIICTKRKARVFKLINNMTFANGMVKRENKC
jgi:hypothetical protein